MRSWNSTADWDAYQSKNMTSVRDGDVVLLSKRTIDDFEDGDMVEYTKDINSGGKFVASTNRVRSGTYSGYQRVRSSQKIISGEGSGLEFYPQAGDTIEAYVYFDFIRTSECAIVIGEQADATYDAGYQFSFRSTSSGDDIRIVKRGTGALASTAVAFPYGEWLRVIIQWGEDGTLTYTVEDSTGAEVATVSATDTEYTSGNFGFFGNNFGDGGREADGYWDDITITNSTSR